MLTPGSQKTGRGRSLQRPTVAPRQARSETGQSGGGPGQSGGGVQNGSGCGCLAFVDGDRGHHIPLADAVDHVHAV